MHAYCEVRKTGRASCRFLIELKTKTISSPIYPQATEAYPPQRVVCQDNGPCLDPSYTADLNVGGTPRET